MFERSLAVFLITASAFVTLSSAEEHAKIRQPKLTPQNSGDAGADCSQSCKPTHSLGVWARWSVCRYDRWGSDLENMCGVGSRSAGITRCTGRQR
jgi:hypothetical protein